VKDKDSDWRFGNPIEYRKKIGLPHTPPFILLATRRNNASTWLMLVRCSFYTMNLQAKDLFYRLSEYCDSFFEVWNSR
jgi:hypothetical protein